MTIYKIPCKPYTIQNSNTYSIAFHLNNNFFVISITSGQNLQFISIICDFQQVKHMLVCAVLHSVLDTLEQKIKGSHFMPYYSMC